MKLSDWAIQNRYLGSDESGAKPGKYDPGFAYFQLGIMDAISNPDVNKVVIMGSIRIGKSMIATNAIGYFADLDPCPMLYVRPNAVDAELFGAEEVTWLFNSTPCLKGKLKENTGKENSNRKDYKKFEGSVIRFRGTGSAAKFSGYQARLVIIDEMEKMQPTPHGHPSEMAEGRAATFKHNKKIIYISNPTFAHNAAVKQKTIHGLFLGSSQAYFHVPCPHCGEFQPLIWENLRYSHCKEKLDDIYYECCHCKGRIRDHQKTQAVKKGKWVETYPDRPTKGFHISQLYSPFTSFEQICADWILVDKSKDLASIMRFKNEVLGLPFEEDLGLYRDSSDALYNRRENYSLVPMGASLLTLAVDTQDGWLSWTLTAWGLDRECWVIDTGRIDGDLDTPGPWAKLQEIISKQYKHESGLELPIEKVLIDTQGHQTTQVNRYLKGRGPLVQGIYGERGPALKPKPIITKPVRDSKTGLRKWEIGSNNAKTDIYSMLATEAPGPRYVHFNLTCGEDYFRELYSYRKVHGKFEDLPSRRHEKLDELAYNLAAYEICLKNYTMEQRASMLGQSIESLKDIPEDELEEMPKDAEKPQYPIRRSEPEPFFDPQPENSSNNPVLTPKKPNNTPEDDYISRIYGGFDSGFRSDIW